MLCGVAFLFLAAQPRQEVPLARLLGDEQTVIHAVKIQGGTAVYKDALVVYKGVHRGFPIVLLAAQPASGKLAEAALVRAVDKGDGTCLTPGRPVSVLARARTVGMQRILYLEIQMATCDPLSLQSFQASGPLWRPAQAFAELLEQNRRTPLPLMLIGAAGFPAVLGAIQTGQPLSSPPPASPSR